MTTQSLRFLCAGGFHLDAVLEGITEVPESLLETITSAPYRATEQVVQAALREEVDFVALTGDLLEAASGGPRAVAFLRKQFELLHDNGIPVYWAASKLDLASDWLQHIDLPDNVHLFTDDLVESKNIVVNDRPAAVLLGRSWNVQKTLRAAEYVAGTADVPHLALLYGSCGLEELPPRVAFWALGGTSATSTNLVGKQVVHQPGWPQAFRSHQVGAHGCTLVQIDSAGDVRTRRIETDVVRWATEQIIVPDGASLNDVRNVLRLRIQKQLAEADRLVLVEWTLGGEGWFNSPLVHEQRRAELLEWLRSEFGKGSQPAWSLSLEVDPPRQLRDEWTDEDSILGDYLRIAREYLEDEAKPLSLEIPVSAVPLPMELQAALPLTGAALRAAVLREAALVGVGLLRGDERAAEMALSAGRDE